MTTTAADINVRRDVMNDYLNAFFNEKLGLVSLGARNDQLTGKPGDTIAFPFWDMIGDAEELEENVAMTVDKLTDDQFKVKIKEVGKAVGFTDTAFRTLVSGDTPQAAKEAAIKEVLRQMALKFAKKVDDDIIRDVLKIATNYHQGFTAGVAADTMNIRNLNMQQTISFGDKAEEAQAHLMHSFHLMDLLNDNSAGFLKADATHPFYAANGYRGLLLGAPVFVNDKVPRLADVGAKQTFASFTFKANPFGLIHAKEFQPEQDRDILARQDIIAGTMWYGVTGFHGKLSPDDRRISMGAYATSVGA